MEANSLSKQKIIKYNNKVNIINGIFAIIATNLVSPYLAKFAVRLGANDFQISLLTSLPSFVCIFTLIPGAVMIERFTNKQKITGLIILIHKVFYLFIAMVPLANKLYQPWLYVVLVGIMNLPLSLGAIGYQSSMGEIFESDMLGTAMARRNKYSTTVGTLIIFISGQMISRIPVSNSQVITLYQILFITAFIISQGEIISFLKFKGIHNKQNINNHKNTYSINEFWSSIYNEKKYIIFSICALIFYFGWQMGFPLFSIYLIRVLKANEIWIGVISIASNLSSIATYSLWAKLADKKGNLYTLVIVGIGMSITPICFAISKNLPTLFILHFFTGSFLGGANQTLFNALLEVSPVKNRTIYIAIFNTSTFITATIAPIVGVILKDLTNIYNALVLVSIFRLLGSASFLLNNMIRSKSNVDLNIV